MGVMPNPAVGGNSDYYGTFINTTNFFSGNVFKGLNVTQTASASMAVVVNPGSGLIREGTFPGQIGYHVAIDTVGGETVTIATANVSNPRIDAIVGYIDKSVTVPSGTNNTNIYKLAAVAGTPGASPVAPTDAQIKAVVGVANPYDIYGTVLVGQNVSQVVNANIADRRSTAINGVISDVPTGGLAVSKVNGGNVGGVLVTSASGVVTAGSSASIETDQGNISAVATADLTTMTFADFVVHTGRIKVDVSFNKLYLGTGGTTIFTVYAGSTSLGEVCRGSTTNLSVSGERIFTVAPGTYTLTIKGNNPASAWQLLQFHSMSATVVEA